MELEYFPPKGTKYEWYPPTLKKRPWWSRIVFQDCLRSLNMQVWRNDNGLYQGRVEFRDIYWVWHYQKTRPFKHPLNCLLKTEALAEKMLAEQGLPNWAEEALRLKWRPPSTPPGLQV